MLSRLLRRKPRHKILDGARKWRCPRFGLVAMCFRLNSAYFSLLRYSEPEMLTPSVRTHVTFCPLRSSYSKLNFGPGA